MTVIASRLLTGACVLGTVFACGEDEVSRPAPPPSWISLSGDDPPPVPDAPLVLRLVLEAEGWAKLRDGRYGRRLGLALVDLPWASDRGLSLREGEREYVADAEAVLRGDMAPGHFGIRGDRLFVQPLAGSPPPGRMELLVPLDEGTSRDGRWRIRVAGLSSDGFLLSSAGSVERSRPTRTGGTLHFATTALGVPGTSARLSVRDDEGVTLFAEDVLAGGGRRFHQALLPTSTADGALRFVVEGDDVLVAVHTPAFVPTTDAPRVRRRDVVVFLADTFRADNLSVYGGADAVTPSLDAFCERSRVWRYAWAPSNWTLPSHASLFFGVHPMQHGAVSRDRAVAAGLRSLADRLHAEGYRTAAFTDAVFVSHRFGLDQGFEWFREREDPHFDWTLDATLAELDEFLAVDDGRPRFVFVQSYRVHSPFKVDDATRAELRDRLPMGVSFEELAERIDPVLREHLLVPGEDLDEQTTSSLIERLVRAPDWRAQLDRMGAQAGVSTRPGEVLERLRANYLGGVADLDAEFGRFVQLLGRRGILDQGYVGFVSDHGEGFGEHSVLFHGEGAWDEVLRVPLVLRGPGLEPGLATDPASLVDLAPTLCRLLDIAPDPGWVGRPLGDSDSRPVIAVDPPDLGECRVVWIDDEVKLVFPIEGDRPGAEPEFVYRYRVDSSERENLSEDGAALAPYVERVDVQRLLDSWIPRGSPRDADVDPDFRRLLEQIGYVGEER